MVVHAYCLPLDKNLDPSHIPLCYLSQKLQKRCGPLKYKYFGIVKILINYKIYRTEILFFVQITFYITRSTRLL